MLLYSWLFEIARKNGSAKALVYRDTYLSWRGLQHRVERRAQELGAMGIEPGDWIGLMLGNVPDFVILALALSKVGAVVVPLDPTTGARDLGLVLEITPLRGLITRPRGGVDAPPAPVGKNAKRIDQVESRRRLQGTLLTSTLYRRPDEAPPPAEVVLFTSDSSGEPKGVLRTAAALEAGADQIAAGLEITADDHILATGPLYQAYGFDLGLSLSLRRGATLYIEDDLASKRVARIIREQEIHVLPATPSTYAGLAQIPTSKPPKLVRARFLSSGSALPEATAEAFRASWGVRVLAAYHTTETQTVALDRKGQNPDSVGKAIDGVTVRVGEGGSVWVRSAAVSPGWIGVRTGGPPSKKKASVPIGSLDGDGWFRTGDLGRLDRTGRLYLTGREDDLVKVDGKRVALGEVDACLEAFPKVKAAQSRVVDDPLAGPMVVAAVVPLGKVVAEEIIDHCARNLASYKVPRRIEFHDRLPT